MFRKSFLMVIILAALVIPFTSKAEVNFCSLNNYSLKIDESTIVTGYTVDAFEGAFKIGVFPNVFSEPTRVNLKDVTKLEKESGGSGQIEAPDGWQQNSDVYEYDFTNKEAYSNEESLIVEVAFGKDTNNHKQIFYFDGSLNEWKQLPTTLDWNKKSAQVKLHFTYVRLAVFDQVGVIGTGKASWYNQALFKYFKYKNGDFAASQQYPKGTKLRVKNLDNDKTVIVTVNDYGPDKWTGRIIDLDVSAFKKLAWKGLGTIDVAIEPVFE